MTMKMRPGRIAEKIRDLTRSSPDIKYVNNRNPRNLEQLRIAYKPDGYHLEKPGRNFWYKLEIMPTGRYVTAQVRHFESGPVISASTSEWAIKKQLFKTGDTAAYVNLARVLAQRCHESGLIEMRCDIAPNPNGKIDKFLRTLEGNGIKLSESTRFKPHRPWDKDRPEKPWEVTE